MKAITQHPGEIGSIQYLRAVAALLVVFQHAHEQIKGLQSSMDTTVGSGGVDIFFVISGFVMIYSTAKRKQSAVFFMSRRIERIVPLYWLITILTGLLLIAWPGLVQNSIFTIDSFFKSLFFIPHLNPGKNELSPMLKLGWTLNFEMFFYCVFALFIRLAPFTRTISVTVVFAAIAIAGHFFGALSPVLQFWSDPIVFEFIFGCLLACLDLEGKLSNVSTSFVSIGFFIGIISFFALGDLDFHRVIVRGIPALLIAGSVIAAERSGIFRLSSSWLKRIGDASYSIYLSHLYAIIAMRLLWTKLHLPANGAGWAAVFVVCCYVSGVSIGLGFYVLFEKRVVDYFKFSRRPGIPPVAPATN